MKWLHALRDLPSECGWCFWIPLLFYKWHIKGQPRGLLSNESCDKNQGEKRLKTLAEKLPSIIRQVRQSPFLVDVRNQCSTLMREWERDSERIMRKEKRGWDKDNNSEREREDHEEGILRKNCKLAYILKASISCFPPPIQPLNRRSITGTAQ